MIRLVRLSKQTQSIMQDLTNALVGEVKTRELVSASILDLDAFNAWMALDEKLFNLKAQKYAKFLCASLKTALLYDLLTHINIDSNSIVKKNRPKSQRSYYLLAIAGSIAAGFEAFDNIATLLGVFTIPSFVILMSALFFSALSIIIFHSLKLTQLSLSFNTSFTTTPKLLDLYAAQMSAIKSLRKKISSYQLANYSTEELEYMSKLLVMMRAQFSVLTYAGQQFQAAITNPKLKLAKTIFSSVAGLMFFAGGFAAGQSVAMFLLGLAIPAISVTSPAVMAISIAIALIMFGLYWYADSQSVQQLITKWIGLDEEKIDILCNPDVLKRQADKLTALNQKIITTAHLTRQIKSTQTLDSPEKKYIQSNPALPSFSKARLHFFNADKKAVDLNKLDESLEVNCLVSR